MKTIFVVAGNQNEFKLHMQDLCSQVQGFVMQSPFRYVIDGKRYVYVFDIRSMRGTHDCDFKFIGTYFERQDFPEIRDYAAMLLRQQNKKVWWAS